jgi:hypothetical protein
VTNDLVSALDPGGDVSARLTETLGRTRAQMIRRVLGAACAVGGGLFAVRAAGAAERLSANDAAILRYDLQLEYLQAQMYTEALRLGRLSGPIRQAAGVVGAHEWAHAAAIRGILGPRRAVERAAFDYRGVTSDAAAFLKTAVAFEDLTAALLKWQAVRLDSANVLAAAASVHSVEARHAAWLRRLAGYEPVFDAFDAAASQPAMSRLIAQTHFAATNPKTGALAAPGFTG